MVKDKIGDLKVREIFREKLMVQIDEKNEPLIIFRGGAGYGKTSAVKMYGQQKKTKQLWYSFSREDDHIDAFIKNIAVSGTELVEELIKERKVQKAGEVFVEQIWENRLDEERIDIVLDDFQNISSEDIYQFADGMIKGLKPGIRVFIMMRGSLPPFMVRRIMDRTAFLFETDHLRLKKEEVCSFAEQNLKGDDTAQAGAWIFDYFRGWPAGAAFAVGYLKENPECDLFHNYAIHSQCWQYVYHEIFQKMPLYMQQFLIDAAVLDKIDSGFNRYIAEETGSPKAPEEMLNFLVGEGLVLYDREKKEYGFSPMLRDFLNSMGRKSRKNEIYKKAIGFFGEKNDYGTAVFCGMKLRDYSAVTRIFKNLDGNKIKKEELKIFRMAVCFLETGDEMPDYVLAEGGKICCRMGEYETGRKYLKLAMDSFYRQEDYERYAELGMILVDAVRRMDNVREAYEIQEKIMYSLSSHPTKECIGAMKRQLEYGLELGYMEQVKKFAANIKSGKVRKVNQHTDFYPLVMWLEKVINEGPEEDDVRFYGEKYRKDFPVLYEYIHWVWCWNLYRKGNTGKAVSALEQGIERCQKAENSVYFYWMKLLFLVLKNDLSHIWTEEEKDTAAQIEKYMEKEQFSYPDFKNREKRIFNSLYGTENKKEDEENELLEVVCLDGTRVWNGHNTVVWRTKKTKELFAYLFHQNGNAVDKDDIIYHLWPEHDIKKASVLCNTTVSYLRKNLSDVCQLPVLVAKNKRYSLDMKYIHSDYEEFEKDRKKAEKGEWDKKKETDLLTRYYHGNYFGNEYGWGMETQAVIENMYFQGIQKVVKKYEMAGDVGTAITILQEAMTYDPYSKELSAMLIMDYIWLGEIKRAKDYYEAVDKLWNMELGQSFPMLYDVLEKMVIERKERT